MKIYVVIINNGAEYLEEFEHDICGVFSSLEMAKRQEPPKGWEFDHIEVWHLDGGYIDTINTKEEESASEIIANPPLPSIGGMMVRKMIAEYERKQY